MRSFLSISLLLILAGFSCRREERILTDAEVSARIDSIVNARTEDVTRRAAEDLDRRSAIEVKVKTDSILDARKGGTASPQPPPNPPATDREP